MKSIRLEHVAFCHLFFSQELTCPAPSIDGVASVVIDWASLVRYAQHALALYRGNVHATARALGVTDRTLLARLDKTKVQGR